MELAQELPKLPPRLVRFFERFPPQLYSAKYTGVTIPLTRRDAKLARIAEAGQQNQMILLEQQEVKTNSMSQSEALTPTPSPVTASSSEETPITTASVTDVNQTSSPRPAPSSTSSRRDRFPPNPFLPFRNPSTGRWAGARIGLRVQADLVKLAKAHKVETLLPPGQKSTAFKEQRILQKGLRVKGTGEGEKVKGHKWERTMGATLEKRREALENMPALVREWERRGHGRGWKQWPRVKSTR